MRFDFLLAGFDDALSLPDGQLEFLREGFEFNSVKPASLKNISPFPIMDALIDDSRPLGSREVSHVVSSHFTPRFRLSRNLS
jgi:hypothetical protein